AQWTAALGHPNPPTAAHPTVRHWNLRDDAAFGNVGAVVLVFNKHREANTVCGFLGLRQRQTFYIRNARLASMNGESHGCKGGEERNQQKNQRARDEPQKSYDPPLAFRCSHRESTDAACGRVIWL